MPPVHLLRMTACGESLVRYCWHCFMIKWQGDAGEVCPRLPRGSIAMCVRVPWPGVCWGWAYPQGAEWCLQMPIGAQISYNYWFTGMQAERVTKIDWSLLMMIERNELCEERSAIRSLTQFMGIYWMIIFLALGLNVLRSIRYARRPAGQPSLLFLFNFLI